MTRIMDAGFKVWYELMEGKAVRYPTVGWDMNSISTKILATYLWDGEIKSNRAFLCFGAKVNG